MKKDKKLKLILNRETLRALESKVLEAAWGGASFQHTCGTTCTVPTGYHQCG